MNYVVKELWVLKEYWKKQFRKLSAEDLETIHEALMEVIKEFETTM